MIHCKGNRVRRHKKWKPIQKKSDERRKGKEMRGRKRHSHGDFNILKKWNKKLQKEFLKKIFFLKFFFSNFSEMIWDIKQHVNVEISEHGYEIFGEKVVKIWILPGKGCKRAPLGFRREIWIFEFETQFESENSNFPPESSLEHTCWSKMNISFFSENLKKKNFLQSFSRSNNLL